jgi:hypothetical protein
MVNGKWRTERHPSACEDGSCRGGGGIGPVDEAVPPPLAITTAQRSRLTGPGVEVFEGPFSCLSPLPPDATLRGPSVNHPQVSGGLKFVRVSPPLARMVRAEEEEGSDRSTSFLPHSQSQPAQRSRLTGPGGEVPQQRWTMLVYLGKIVQSHATLQDLNGPLDSPRIAQPPPVEVPRGSQCRPA